MNAMIMNDVYTRNGEEIEMNFYTNISISKKVAFVSAVIDTVVGDDYYYPMLKDMMFDFQLVNFFSDVDTDIDFDNDSAELLDEIEEFLSETNVADILKLNIDFDVLTELYDSVDKAIEYKTGIHPSPIADSIASLLDTVEKKFDGIDMDSMKDMANVFGKLQGNITPEKMLEAYAKSDVFKQQRDEVVEKQAKRDAAMEKVRENVAQATNDVKNGTKAKSPTKRKSAAKTKTAKKDSSAESGFEVV